MSDKKIVFSKSLLNAYDDYKAAKLCGLVFEAQYIERTIVSPTSAARNLGQWFEFWATGAMPAYPDPAWPIDPIYGVKMPPIDYSVTGLNKKKTIGRGKNKIVIPTPEYIMLEPFQRAKRQADLFKEHLERLGIEIISVGERITLDDDSGVLDLRVSYKGVEMKLDLKYSGLIEYKWNEMGWEKNSISSKTKLTSQPLHYNHIEPETPFAWMIYSSGEDEDVKFYPVEIAPDTMLWYEKNLHDKKQMLAMDVMNGFRAYPTYKGCKSCPLQNGCRHFVNYPIPETIYL